MHTHLLRFLADFLKIGVIGFGGGSALIPVVEREVVVNRGSLSSEEFLKHTVVANITPGALPVKLAATCGMQLHGAAGSFLAAVAVSAPGVAGTVLLIHLFSTLDARALDVLNHAGIGVTVFIAFLLCHYVMKTVRAGSAAANALLCALAFAATGGKEAREIVELALGLAPRSLGVPLLNISMIHLMIASMGLIALFLFVRSRPGRCAGCLAALAFVAVCGDAFRAAFSAAAAPAVPVAAAEAGGYAAFFGGIALSTLTSFGGGEAYVSVADSIFVQAGHVDAEVFYNRIVPVANALPGPILVKIAAALGYVWGAAAGGPSLALLAAGACFLLPVCLCSGVALAVLHFYDALRHSPFVLALKRCILPVICGSLLSTSLAILCESAKVGARYGYPPPATLFVMGAGVVLVFWLRRRFRLHDLLLLALCLCGGIAVMAAQSPLCRV